MLQVFIANTIQLLSSSLVDVNFQHFEGINLHATQVFSHSQKFKAVIMSLHFDDLVETLFAIVALHSETSKSASST